ncbi:hypothetical protein BKA61DRAFT_582506 [Leptodontidium sp. MPI-SDFR-AT-0119]|nr:hypothetical protein BKA61DRAFT_582506 [Leptodontidium sp. MPI-SDFR-AT-0119]
MATFPQPASTIWDPNPAVPAMPNLFGQSVLDIYMTSHVYNRIPSQLGTGRNWSTNQWSHRLLISNKLAIFYLYNDDSISICQAVVEKFFSRTYQNRGFIWRSIRHERTNSFIRIALICCLLTIFLDVGVPCNLSMNICSQHQSRVGKPSGKPKPKKRWNLEYNFQTSEEGNIEPPMTRVRLIDLHHEFGMQGNTSVVSGAYSGLIDSHSRFGVDGERLRREALDKVYADADGTRFGVIEVLNVVNLRTRTASHDYARTKYSTKHGSRVKPDLRWI